MCVPVRMVAGLVGVFRNGGGLGKSESYIPVMFFDPLLHRFSCFPDVDFAALAGNPGPVDYAILFSLVDDVLWSHQGWPKSRVRLEDNTNALLFLVAAERLRYSYWTYARGILPEKLGGGVRPASHNDIILTLFLTKICDIPNPIYDLTKNSKPYLRPDLTLKSCFRPA